MNVTEQGLWAREIGKAHQSHIFHWTAAHSRKLNPVDVIYRIPICHWSREAEWKLITCSVSCLFDVFPGLLGQCISVTSPRGMAGRRLDNCGVRMLDSFDPKHIGRTQ